MKKIVIYRDKETNNIVNFHDYNEKCTLDKLQKYNSDENCKKTAEIVELTEIAEYFYNSVKTPNIYEDIVYEGVEYLKQIQEDLVDITSRLDNKLYDIEDLLEESEED